jgi:quinol monooxygenase YgiN
MLIMYCVAQVRPEKVELYEQTFRDLRTKVLANEPGVTFYELCRDPQKPYSYRLFEAYADEGVQREHLDKDYYRAASKIIVSCLDGEHLKEVERRRLTDPAEIYPLITSLTMELLQPV